MYASWRTGKSLKLKAKARFTAPAKQTVGQEAAENPGEITSDFTGQAQRIETRMGETERKGGRRKTKRFPPNRPAGREDLRITND